MIHAENTEGTIAGFVMFDQWPWICGHDIPRDRDRCDCGARRAVIAVDYQPVLEPADGSAVYTGRASRAGPHLPPGR